MMKENEIPIIDFAKCGLLIRDKNGIDEADWTRTGKQLYEAFSTSGFAYISNTGIEREKIDEINSLAEQFYTLPAEAKQKHFHDNLFYGGYDPVGRLKVDPKRLFDYQEGFRVTPLSFEDDSKVWPGISQYKEKHVEFAHTCKLTTLRIFKALAIGMKLKDDDQFCKSHSLLNQKGNSSFMKTIRYPPILDEHTLLNNQLRIGEHTDGGSLTLLFQDDNGGLQVQTPDGKFIDAHPIPGTVVLNIADALQFWSGGRLKSTVHRVVPPADTEKKLKTRRSVIYFAIPDDDVMLEELEFENSTHHIVSEKVTPVTTLEFLTKRFDDYFQ